MTFAEISAAIAESDLTLVERKQLCRLIRRSSRRGHPSVYRGSACSTNHPGIESRWFERTEARRNARGIVVVYFSRYCASCSKFYSHGGRGSKVRRQMPEEAPVPCCPHRRQQHIEGECYHRDPAGKFDCDCVSGERRTSERATQEATL